MVLNVFFTTGLAKIYQICLEFAKMGQSTDKNAPAEFKYKFWHSAHAHDHDLRTVLALELFEAACNSRTNDRQ